MIYIANGIAKPSHLSYTNNKIRSRRGSINDASGGLNILHDEQTKTLEEFTYRPSQNHNDNTLNSNDYFGASNKQKASSSNQLCRSS